VTGLVIAEDSAILRDGLAQLLVERGHEVMAKVGTADDMLAGHPEGVGYLLKDRVTDDIAEFDAAVRRVEAGGTALDPEVVRQLIGNRRTSSTLERLTPREREVLALMAEGHSNSVLAQHLSITERAVEKHVSAVFTKLDLPPSQAHHRRVLAVVTYLNS
jgi:DNA-binding NarL/FixJ family response regulator